MDRRERRQHILIQVYFYTFYPADEFEKQCENYLAQHEMTMEEREALKGGAAKVIEHVDELDEAINTVAKWKTSRMSKIDLAIMRLALYEMRYDIDVPEKVAINEAVELAKKYGKQDSPVYINGILGSLATKER